MKPTDAIEIIDDVLSSPIHYDESIEYQLTTDDIDWLEEAKRALEKQKSFENIFDRKRLTTDSPNGNCETMMNYAYAKDNRVILRYGDGEEDIDLCEYIAKEAKEIGCNLSSDDVMEGACIECDCPLAILYVVATQAAELRGRLKEIEDKNEIKNEEK